MPDNGFLQLRAYTSTAQFPLQDVAITVTAPDGTAIAMRHNQSVPDRSESLQPDPAEKPFTAVNLFARKRGYEQVESENLQIFADTTTYQNLEMIPLAELPDGWDQTVIYDTPPQNL